MQPAIAISDSRPTVAIAAELAATRHASLVNVHWSPFRRLGFDSNPGLEAPPAKRSASEAINAVRRRYGLPLVRDYCDLITRGDFTLYPEPPELVATRDLPPHHLFLGPLLWSPSVPKPSWWQAWNRNLPTIYLTLGSTGLADKLAVLIDALRPLQANILVATASRAALPASAQRGTVYIADYLPGDEVARLADVVVCNGGSATSYQALSEGTPTIGLWSNLDQYLTSNVIGKVGAGLCCHADKVDAETIFRTRGNSAGGSPISLRRPQGS